MIKFMEMQQQISQMQQMQDQHQQYLKNSLARSKNMEIQISQIAEQMAITQSMEVQTNTQTNPDEKDSILPEEYGESVEEDIEKNEE
jgi:pimeloyl-CoA synthetase